MSLKFRVCYTDTFNGEPNYSWVRRSIIHMPELTHYGYDGSNGYAKANRKMEIQLIRRAKKESRITGVRGRVTRIGDDIEFRPYSMNTIMFIEYDNDYQK